MAIRLRKVKGTWVALCAYETNKKKGDVYLDDAKHYSLTCKFAHEFEKFTDKKLLKLEKSQQIRDANNRKDLK